MREEIEEILSPLKAVLAEPPASRSQAEKASRAAQLMADYFALLEQVRELTKGTGLQSPLDQDLSGLALHEAARHVLADAGRPLHARELGRRIKERGWRHPRSTNARPEQIVFQLAARLPRYPETFQRVARNTFALTEWEGSTAPTQRPPPRLGTFTGGGQAVGELIGSSDEPFAQGESWRSS